MAILWIRGSRALCALLFVFGIATIGIQTAHAASYKVLHTFAGPDGANPYAALVRDKTGNLYGTTFNGGNLTACDGMGCGVVFKLSPGGNFTVLHIFTGGTDGASANGGLVRDSAGNLYGTTSLGGDLAVCGGFGCGVVFKLDTADVFSVLYTFEGGPDGGAPYGGLILDANNDLYGTTSLGGDTRSCRGYGCGVVFKLDALARETLLHTFGGRGDGADPLGDLVRDNVGNIYGATHVGGDLMTCGGLGCGVIFKLTASGKCDLLHTFTGGHDGALPWAGLIRDTAGILYGTTSGGGLGYGTVFKIHGHTQTVLHSFKGAPDGIDPMGVLARDKQGNFYGTTFGGGSGRLGGGTVFELNTEGVETLLHNFSVKNHPEQGDSPHAGLVRDSKGNLYGTTFYGGDGNCQNPSGCGVIFKLTP